MSKKFYSVRLLAVTQKELPQLIFNSVCMYIISEEGILNILVQLILTVMIIMYVTYYNNYCTCNPYMYAMLYIWHTYSCLFSMSDGVIGVILILYCCAYVCKLFTILYASEYWQFSLLLSIP